MEPVRRRMSDTGALIRMAFVSNCYSASTFHALLCGHPPAVVDARKNERRFEADRRLMPIRGFSGTIAAAEVSDGYSRRIPLRVGGNAPQWRRKSAGQSVAQASCRTACSSAATAMPAAHDAGMHR